MLKFFLLSIIVEDFAGKFLTSECACLFHNPQSKRASVD